MMFIIGLSTVILFSFFATPVQAFKIELDKSLQQLEQNRQKSPSSSKNIGNLDNIIIDGLTKNINREVEKFTTKVESKIDKFNDKIENNMNDFSDKLMTRIDSVKDNIDGQVGKIVNKADTELNRVTNLVDQAESQLKFVLQLKDQWRGYLIKIGIALSCLILVPFLCLLGFVFRLFGSIRSNSKMNKTMALLEELLTKVERLEAQLQAQINTSQKDNTL